MTPGVGAAASFNVKTKSGVRILFWTRTWPLVASGHYRCSLPAAALRDHGGHETAAVRELLVDNYTGRFAGRTIAGDVVEDADVVVLHRPRSLGFIDEVRAARRAGQVIIGDLDDWYWSGLPFGDAEVEREVKDMRSVLRECDAITTTTPYIADRLQAWGPSVYVVPNAIEVSAWGEPEDVSDGPVLGWTAAIGERLPDVQVLKPWLGRFLEKHDLRFIHTGDHVLAAELGCIDLSNLRGRFAELADVDPERVSYRPLLPWHLYAPSRPLQAVDIQLIPIADSPYNRGKSALKGLESAACGVPFVASPSAEYQGLGFGRLAGSDLARQRARHWEGALEAMLDPAERQRAAREARRGVDAQDIRERWSDWEAVYAELLGE